MTVCLLDLKGWTDALRLNAFIARHFGQMCNQMNVKEPKLHTKAVLLSLFFWNKIPLLLVCVLVKLLHTTAITVRSNIQYPYDI